MSAMTLEAVRDDMAFALFALDGQGDARRFSIKNITKWKESIDAAIRALKTPQPPAPKVTDAMVDRALRAPFGQFSVSSFVGLKSSTNTHDLMRAALESALGTQPSAPKVEVTDAMARKLIYVLEGEESPSSTRVAYTKTALESALKDQP